MGECTIAKSAKDAIQMDDPDNGKLILKGFVAGDDETFRGILFYL